ncbi:Hypothetical predicted protein [Octopus vulgaris]|uniref:Uncharacterized protein n=1 Tax=Octopus vulgaris TaxID=6645 RepID=A0AA36BLY1_OCTVU|nr:Hypothetical predicted protein [Octopus vulgaris]
MPMYIAVLYIWGTMRTEVLHCCGTLLTKLLYSKEYAACRIASLLKYSVSGSISHLWYINYSITAPLRVPTTFLLMYIPCVVPQTWVSLPVSVVIQPVVDRGTCDLLHTHSTIFKLNTQHRTAGLVVMYPNCKLYLSMYPI